MELQQPLNFSFVSLLAQDNLQCLLISETIQAQYSPSILQLYSHVIILYGTALYRQTSNLHDTRPKGIRGLSVRSQESLQP